MTTEPGWWRGDFRRLWSGYAISQLGSAIGSGELAIVAALVLHAPVWQVSVIAAFSGLTAAALVLPLGPWIEFRRKRPVMMGADLVRFAALATVPAAAVLGWLTFVQLCVVGVIQVGGAMVFGAASTAHLKSLLPASARGEANADLEATSWTATTAGPPIGGVLISAFGAVSTVLLDAVSFLFSAAFVRSLRSTEPSPPAQSSQRGRAAEIGAGWAYIWRHRVLRSLFLNALLFGGGIMWISPLLTVFMLRELHLAPWQYGLSLGIQGCGGLVGALVAKRRIRSSSGFRLMLVTGTARCLPVCLLAVAPRGWAGLIVVTLAETTLLFFAGMFNPTFGTYRMTVTPDGLQARVNTAWSISSKVAQPLMVALGGLVAALSGIRLSIGLASVLIIASAALLPWRQRQPSESLVESVPVGSG
ncbi:MFS transporter [Flexivirga caeni]|uniref:MFS transporter n=1 Tax=Flexivirga caeni TaxID=2294115 RepID=A0A3M9MIK1_9MICO|nr:MFS transporter [Flexivirga caeni]RNI25336.1 MFS transporter [Flexivirga caeni]